MVNPLKACLICWWVNFGKKQVSNITSKNIDLLLNYTNYYSLGLHRSLQYSLRIQHLCLYLSLIYGASDDQFVPCVHKTNLLNSLDILSFNVRSSRSLHTRLHCQMFQFDVKQTLRCEMLKKTNKQTNQKTEKYSF